MNDMSTNPQTALDALFLSARSHAFWTDKPVSDDTLRALYETLIMGPTSTNCCPGRFLFLRGASKDRLMTGLWPGNVAKVQAAPVSVLVAFDREFYTRLPQLFVHRPEVAEQFVGNQDYADYTAFQNATLQVAYLIVVARAMGLDCGPMTGFERDKIDAEFFPDGRLKSNVIVNLGYGDHSKLFPRLPRLAFEDACEILN